MAEEKELVGWERSRAAQKGHGRLYTGLAIVTALATGIWIGSRVFADPNSSAFGLNLWTEALGMLVTVGLFGLINEWQAERRYKDQLVDEAASTSNEIAKHAVHVMRRRMWIRGSDGLLKGKDLMRASLKDAYLRAANLQRAKLVQANLERADLLVSNLDAADLTSASLQSAKLVHSKLRNTSLINAQLQGADASYSNFEKANLQGAHLEGADLRESNLKESHLMAADLKGANLRDANLEDANLIDAIFDEKTILPDGRQYHEGIDMGQFTDRTHPGFWWSFNSMSPAYRGGDETWKRRGLAQ